MGGMLIFAIKVLLIIFMFACVFYQYMEWNSNMTVFPYGHELCMAELTGGKALQKWIDDNQECICNFMLPPQYAWAYNVLKFNILFGWATITFNL